MLKNGRTSQIIEVPRLRYFINVAHRVGLGGFEERPVEIRERTVDAAIVALGDLTQPDNTAVAFSFFNQVKGQIVVEGAICEVESQRLDKSPTHWIDAHEITIERAAEILRISPEELDRNIRSSEPDLDVTGVPLTFVQERLPGRVSAINPERDTIVSSSVIAR